MILLFIQWFYSLYIFSVTILTATVFWSFHTCAVIHKISILTLRSFFLHDLPGDLISSHALNANFIMITPLFIYVVCPLNSRCRSSGVHFTSPFWYITDISNISIAKRQPWFFVYSFPPTTYFPSNMSSVCQ